MSELVLDASVVIKWWRTEGEPHLAAARALRSSFESGDLVVVVPPLLLVEVLNVFGRRWRWSEPHLIGLAEALDACGFEVSEPELRSVARWTARGLTAYDACYVALAEARSIPLVTADDVLLAAAPEVARSLSA